MTSACMGAAMRDARSEISSRAFWRLKQQRRQLPGTSSCGLCGVEALEQALPQLAQLPPSALPPSHWLLDLRQRIGEFQPLGRDCGAVHAALFMDATGELRLGREDIGRHNALDKLIGAMARVGCEPAGGLAIVTSRCSLELVHRFSAPASRRWSACPRPQGSPHNGLNGTTST